ncbi:MAG: DUF11 domain-containing protein, partial [Chloroflexi bacterium]|nr:DUF11 domain-containing protein [Chloroflexota bacterium]
MFAHFWFLQQLRRAKFLFAKLLAIIFIGGLSLLGTSEVYAAVTLTVSPITWNIIGLDSNNPASGPNRFPIGVRVCSSVATTNVVVNWVWDSSNVNVNLRPGSLSSITIASIAAGNCSDAYFEVEITQVAGAYDTTRRYHITATDLSGTASSPTPRELYVEHLISQNRNGITNIKLNGTAIPAGGTMNLMVGNTYTIELDGFTATQGYNQLESFINFPNTIFQILSVSTTYTADSNTTNVPNPNTKLYSDACIWDNDPTSPTYRSCIGGDDKAGGTVIVTYTVKIISGAGSSQSLNTLLYDFSGSSYHYNSDFSAAARTASIIGPSSVTIQKTFTPKAISPGGTSAMSFKLANPTTETFTGVNFTDSLPSGETTISFANGTLSPNSVCTITVNVTAASAGTYLNTTGHLFINTSTDTGNTGSDTLTVSSVSACTPNQTLANWTVPSTATNPPDTTGGIPTTIGANVSSAVAVLNSTNSGGSSIENSSGQNDTFSWKTFGWKTAGTQVLFKVDTSNYSSNTMSFYARNDSPGPTSLTVEYSTDNGSTYSGTTTSTVNLTFTQSSISIPQNNTVWVKITASGANNDNVGADLFLDNNLFTGCSIPVPAPTITKSFASPIIKGATSTLSFTINNTASGNQALTGVAFSDVLPSGLSVADATTSQCGGTNNLTTTAATRTIALTGGVLAAGASCNFNVTVTGTSEGVYDNISGFISSTQSGTSTNYATASLTVIAPPVLAKSFSPTSIFTGNDTILSFTISNPNLSSSLSGIGFTDTLPAGVTVATGGPTTMCSGTVSTTAPSTITFSGGSLAANTNCTFSITVTGATSGTKNNTTTAVTSTEGGNGNIASGSVVVNDQTASLDLTKQVSVAGIDPWTWFIGVATGSNVYYRFKIYNSGDLQFTSLSVSDPTLASTSVDPATCNWTGFLPLAPGDTATCIKGPISATSGSHPNTATAQGTFASGTKISSPSTATYATTGLTIAKSATETYFNAAGNLLHYNYLVTNTGFAPLLGPVTVADDKSTNESCPAVSTVGDGDNYLDPGESIVCTATYV